ncbi:phosphoribosyltransferase family protein [uncultured Sneathia sp.]|uniref:ComF family protein n=1 Tax=uncultured Sneathia sp. TaxID=278067 RepID=UPI002803951A|nr:phosphoribosyltransferase family protein [uncultured Sneathia sp.]
MGIFSFLFDKHEYEIGKTKYEQVKKLAHFYSIENVHFSMYYNDYFRDMIYELKYKRKKYVATAIYSIIRSQVEFVVESQKIEYIICVPTSKERIRDRGFDQVELIFEKFNYPFLKIQKIKNTKKMSKLSKSYQKNLNILQSFDVKNLNLSNKTVLIVDDIITTGATVNEIKKCLEKEYKGIKVLFYSIAISRKFIKSLIAKNL